MSTSFEHTGTGKQLYLPKDRCCICNNDLIDGYAVLFKTKSGIEARIDQKCHNAISALANGNGGRRLHQALNYIKAYSADAHPFVRKYLQRYVNHGEEVLGETAKSPGDLLNTSHAPIAQSRANARFADGAKGRPNTGAPQRKPTGNSVNRSNHNNSTGALNKIIRFYKYDKHTVKIAAFTVGLRKFATGLLALALGLTLVFVIIGNSKLSSGRQERSGSSGNADKNGTSDTLDVNRGMTNMSAKDNTTPDNGNNMPLIPNTDDAETYTVISAHDFSEGKAWISVIDSENKNTYVCIDKNGRALFRYTPGTYASIESDYSNGFTIFNVIKDYKQFYIVVNGNGVITNKFELADNATVMAYGDGYILICKKQTGFDSNINTYEVYDGYGDLLYEFSIDLNDNVEHELTAAYYCGEGVFMFREYIDKFSPNSQQLWILFSNEKYLARNVRSDYEIYLYPSTAENGVLCYYVSSEGCMFMSSDGRTWTVPYDCDWSWQDCDFYGRSYGGALIKNGSLILVSSADDNEIIRYDMSSSKFYQLDEEYSRRIELDRAGLMNLNFFENGHVMVPLRGDDGMMYAAVFDKAFNLAGELVQYDSIIGYSSDRLIIMRDKDYCIYDGIGKHLFDVPSEYEDTFIRSLKPYSDGVAQITFRDFMTYINSDGMLLYNDVNDIGIGKCGEIRQ